MQKIIQSKIFWSFFVITLVTGLIFFLNSFQGFQSQMDILLIPKSEITAKNADQIQNDTAKIILSLSFYNQLLDSENVSTELSLGRTASEQKSDWQKKVAVKKSKNSNILSIFAYNIDKTQAEILSQKVALQISDTMSEYYDIKNDLEIRIIDGPVTEKKTSLLNPLVWILSLLFAIASGLVAFLVTNSFALAPKPERITFFENYLPEKNERILEEEPYVFPSQIKETFPEEDIIEEEALKEEIPEIPQEETFQIFPLEDFFPQEEQVIEEKVESDESFEIPSKKASAPANLPFASDLNLNFQKEEQTSQEEILEILEKAKTSHDSGVHEATPKEIKERLNRLLKG